MSSPEISDDDDSFERPRRSSRVKKNVQQDPIIVSSEDSSDTILLSEDNLTSDDSVELPDVRAGITEKRDELIKNLFPGVPKNVKPFPIFPPTKNVPSTSSLPNLQVPSHKRMIGGVQVDFPVPPYGVQIALMSKVIEGITKGVNCLLESPTGSGKTLALICGALAWQRHEQSRISNAQVQQSVSQHQAFNYVPDAADANASSNSSPVKLFARPAFGEKNIYGQSSSSAQDGSGGSNDFQAFGTKRLEADTDWDMESNQEQVTIHGKRRKLASPPDNGPGSVATPRTPEKAPPAQQNETLKSFRVPTIYYGARTHKQIQQVVKEFSRTVYCGGAKMTVLSSREYSCIREFDRSLYKTKNDMCRECIKKVKVPKLEDQSEPYSTNCKFYENRMKLTNDQLPPAFDLEDLVSRGREMSACPYFAARQMAAAAQVVFCPYNYLIDPGIRSSLQIQIRDEIIILDEAHNIEDICRDSATFTVAKEQVLAALGELENLAGYEIANRDIREEILYLVKTMKNWNEWFINQLPLVQNRPINNNEAVYTFQVNFFVDSLNNHNIGYKDYPDLKMCLEAFTLKYQSDPSTFYGVTQATVSLMEGMMTVLGYLYRDECKHMDDFKPALVKASVPSDEASTDSRGWRSSQFASTQKECLSLRLLCLNPGVVFSGLSSARCVILASGTLTPLLSLRSELGAAFPLQLSPGHVIPRDRVWIGSLTTCPNGRPLECKSSATSQTDIQDALGSTVLWVSKVTPNGVLCFLPSYQLMNRLTSRWRDSGLWRQLADAKHVFMESRNVKDHSDIMDEYYRCVASSKGALLFAVYRGKVSEGMDFKDHQARAVITVGIPYPNTFDMSVKEKMSYNERHASRALLAGGEWLRVQAYRALNQAVGRCVRHRGDWGAVLLVDSRFAQPYYTEHLSKWVKGFLGNNHHTFESLVKSPNGLESFMQTMTLQDEG